jgi:hypothetical protein
MPKVPEYNHKPVRSIYNPIDPDAPASMKQKNFITTLCERRKITIDIIGLTKAKAAQIISEMLSDNYYA